MVWDFPLHEGVLDTEALESLYTRNGYLLHCIEAKLGLKLNRTSLSLSLSLSLAYTVVRTHNISIPNRKCTMKLDWIQDMFINGPHRHTLLSPLLYGPPPSLPQGMLAPKYTSRLGPFGHEVQSVPAAAFVLHFCNLHVVFKRKQRERENKQRGGISPKQ